MNFPGTSNVISGGAIGEHRFCRIRSGGSSRAPQGKKEYPPRLRAFSVEWAILEIVSVPGSISPDHSTRRHVGLTAATSPGDAAVTATGNTQGVYDVVWQPSSERTVNCG